MAPLLPDLNEAVTAQYHEQFRCGQGRYSTHQYTYIMVGGMLLGYLSYITA